MKKTGLILMLLILTSGIKSQHLSKIISEKDFINKNRLTVADFPKAELPQNMEELIATVYLKGDPISCDGNGISLHGKCANGYVLLDSIPCNIVYNPKKSPSANYLNGEIRIISGMPMSESESIAKFKFTNSKLVFIENDIFDPNADLEKEIDEALSRGDIKEAAELYLGVQSPPWGYLESAQITLLNRAHEKAMEFSKKKDFKSAAETMGYAWDFYTGINEETRIGPDSKEAKAIADYTYFLLNTKDYQKCIEVCRVIISLSPGLAGPYLHLGNSLYATEQKEEAKKPYQKFIEIRKAKKEENRIPAYVYERLNMSKDGPEVIVYKFFKWYFDNKINEIELTNWSDPNMKFYRVNFTASENYLKKLQSTGFVSKIYIDKWRTYFKKCDEAFLKEKQNDGPPGGFEFDFITNSQEKPAKVLQSDFKLLDIKGNTARVNYAGYLVYVLQLEENSWKIVGIE